LHQERRLFRARHSESGTRTKGIIPLRMVRGSLRRSTHGRNPGGSAASFKNSARGRTQTTPTGSHPDQQKNSSLQSTFRYPRPGLLWKTGLYRTPAYGLQKNLEADCTCNLAQRQSFDGGYYQLTDGIDSDSAVRRKRAISFGQGRGAPGAVGLYRGEVVVP